MFSVLILGCRFWILGFGFDMLVLRVWGAPATRLGILPEGGPVLGSGFQFLGIDFQFWGFRLRFGVSDCGVSVKVSGLRLETWGSRVQGSRSRGFEFSVWGVEFMV